MTPDNQQRIEKATAELKEAFSDKVTVKFKKLHPDAKAPIRATDGAAGWDLTVLSSECYGSFVHYKTGIAVEIPSGYFGLLVPRSSCYKLLHRPPQQGCSPSPEPERQTGCRQTIRPSRR